MPIAIKVDEVTLNRIAALCYGELTNSSSKESTLKAIAHIANEHIGEYFGPDILSYPDEVSVNFIQLLDQIIFETRKSDDVDAPVKEYVYDDLFLRINIYLDALNDRDTYKGRLQRRYLTKDDTVIMKHYTMKEYIPLLISEFYEENMLKIPILKTLISFKASELLNFYQTILTNDYPSLHRTMALTGLKNMDAPYEEWEYLANETTDFEELIEYIRDFGITDIGKNNQPDTLLTQLFVLVSLELNSQVITTEAHIKWLFDFFNNILSQEKDESTFPDLYTAISNILIAINTDLLYKHLSTDRSIAQMMDIMDLFPREHFGRVTIKLDHMGEDFILLFNKYIEKKKIEQDTASSNTLSYLFWKTSV